MQSWHNTCMQQWHATIGIVLKGNINMNTVTLNQVKSGDYIKRKADAKSVYIKGTYNKASKSFSCIDTDDINKEIFIKANKPVFVGFTY
mgnify:FL=1